MKEKKLFFFRSCISMDFTPTNKGICCLYEVCPHTFFSAALNTVKTVHPFFLWHFKKTSENICSGRAAILLPFWKLALKVWFGCTESIDKAQRLDPKQCLQVWASFPIRCTVLSHAIRNLSTAAYSYSHWRPWGVSQDKARLFLVKFQHSWWMLNHPPTWIPWSFPTVWIQLNMKVTGVA